VIIVNISTNTIGIYLLCDEVVELARRRLGVEVVPKGRSAEFAEVRPSTRTEDYSDVYRHVTAVVAT
jgi:hypothetical protein